MTVTDTERPPVGHRNRPWFGPKRFGWGLRPQTWQGWVIIIVPALIAIAAVVLVR
jgi:hypothetical protein